MKILTRSLVTAAFIALTVTGCAPSISPDTYSTSGAGQVNRVIAGRVVSARVVNVSGDSLTQGGGVVGTVAGAGAGAIAAGSAIGGGNGSAIAAIGGAVLGGVLGNYAEKKITSQQGMEYVVKTNGGDMISVVQGISPRFSIGQHVLVEYGARARVAIDPSYNSN